MLLLRGQLLHKNRFICRFQNITFTSLVTDERTDGHSEQTDEQAGRQHIAPACQSNLQKQKG